MSGRHRHLWYHHMLQPLFTNLAYCIEQFDRLRLLTLLSRYSILLLLHHFPDPDVVGNGWLSCSVMPLMCV